MIRPIRMLPLALIAAALGNGLAVMVGLDPTWAAVVGAAIGGGVLGRLCREPQTTN